MDAQSQLLMGAPMAEVPERSAGKAIERGKASERDKKRSWRKKGGGGGDAVPGAPANYSA